MSFQAKVICDSISDFGIRLTTIEVTFPRIILAEMNTHRVFSRNYSSSRAIPVRKMIERVKKDPFIPEFWGKNQPGMQAETELEDSIKALKLWQKSLDEALDTAEQMSQIGLHKQLANRILEPFSWTTGIISSTEWDNFFELRLDCDAQPEIRRIAKLMRRAIDQSTPSHLDLNEWHMPYVTEDDFINLDGDLDKLHRVSVARCARVSYLNHDGKLSYDKDFKLYKQLYEAGHMSPFEHVAVSVFPVHNQAIKPSNFRGWTQLRKLIEAER